MRALIIILSLLAFTIMVEAMRLNGNIRQMAQVGLQADKNTDVVNGESIDGIIKKEKGIKYNTEFQVIPSKITKLFTTIDDPEEPKTDEEIRLWLMSTESPH